MSDTEDQVINPPEGRSALEKHIFGLSDEEAADYWHHDPSSAEEDGDMDGLGDEQAETPEALKKRQETSDLLKEAIRAQRSGKLKKAETLYRRVLRDFPNVATAWGNLGILLRRRQKTEAAVICLRRGLALRAEDGISWSNLGNALRDLGRYEEAIKAHRRAIELEPGAAQIHYNLGLVHRDLGHLDDADDCFRRAELLGYDRADLRWDHALLHLLKGEMKPGFEGFEARWQLQDFHPHFPEIPIWKGADLTGQVLMVYAENGLGDSIQFLRYLPFIASHAETILFHCHASIVRLAQEMLDPEKFQILSFEDELPEDIDAVIPLLSLPRMLGTTLETIPADVPYLKIPQSDVPTIAKGGSARLRVGLAWAGSSDHKNDHNRSLPIDQLSRILDLPAIQFYGLQVGERSQEIEACCFDTVIRDLSPHIRDFADTASLMQSLDLVISVDTAVAHLAGALNIPVWTLLPFAPDWRWQMVRGDSVWYPSMNLIRQTSAGDWNEVMHRVRDRLITLLHQENG